MIFNVPGHIEMIRNGQKTQTRRLNRGIYQIGRDYAVHKKRGVKAEPDIRIAIDGIWLETDRTVRTNYFLENIARILGSGILFVYDIPLSIEDAWAEGGYTPITFEQLFRELNPKWDGVRRWGFKYHVIEVKK